MPMTMGEAYQIFVMKTYVEVLDVRIDDIEQSIKNSK